MTTNIIFVPAGVNAGNCRLVERESVPQAMTGLANGDYALFNTSAASLDLKVDVRVPGEPTGLAALAGNGQVTLSWLAPASDGGTAIIDYKVEYQPSGGSWTVYADGAGTATGATVTGLAQDTSHAFRVSAVNAVGTGAASAPVSATPTAAWSPRALFAAGEIGVWYDPSDLSTLFQDEAGTLPVTGAGQPVGLMLDKSGNRLHATQTTAAKRPLLQQDAGGRYHLYFDGVDDALATAAIPFATDEVTVLAGLRKLLDVRTQVAVELSPIMDTNPGAFTLAAPGSSGARRFVFITRGSLATQATAFTSSATHDAPISTVVCGSGKIGADTAVLRLGGIQSGSSNLDQGTGNYGAYPLHIGARNGSTLFWNGQLYGLVIRGALTSGTALASAEAWLATKSGVTFG